MSCRELLDRKLRHFENRSDIEGIREWMERGRIKHRGFLERYPFRERPDEINELTPQQIWNPAAPTESFLGWLICQLRPLGGLNENLADKFPIAARNASLLKRLLALTVSEESLAAKVDQFTGLPGFGGGKHVAKKIIACYFLNECLPIFSIEHMQKFATDFRIDVQSACARRYGQRFAKNTPTEGQKWELLTDLLLSAKRHHEALDNRDNVYFMYVLYFSPPAPLSSTLREPWIDTSPVWCDQQPVEPVLSLADLIQRGECDEIEFKPCLLQDAQGTKGRRDMRKEAAKEIAGFLNAEGGKLLIGVSDSGEILGIDGDLNILHPEKRTHDQLELSVRDVVRDYLRPAPDPSLLRVAFDESQGPTVCIVAVGRSGRPIFVSDNGEHLYVRAGNRTDLRQTPDAVSYIQDRFPREATYPERSTII